MNKKQALEILGVKGAYVVYDYIAETCEIREGENTYKISTRTFTAIAPTLTQTSPRKTTKLKFKLAKDKTVGIS